MHKRYKYETVRRRDEFIYFFKNTRIPYPFFTADTTPRESMKCDVNIITDVLPHMQTPDVGSICNHSYWKVRRHSKRGKWSIKFNAFWHLSSQNEPFFFRQSALHCSMFQCQRIFGGFREKYSVVSCYCKSSCFHIQQLVQLRVGSVTLTAPSSAGTRRWIII